MASAPNSGGGTMSPGRPDNSPAVLAQLDALMGQPRMGSGEQVSIAIDPMDKFDVMHFPHKIPQLAKKYGVSEDVFVRSLPNQGRVTQPGTSDAPTAPPSNSDNSNGALNWIRILMRTSPLHGKFSEAGQ